MKRTWLQKIRGKKKRNPANYSVAKLKKQLDSVFSKWVRKQSSQCYTCPNRATQAGHYVSRMHNALRYSEINVHPQCVVCNVFKHGNMDVYALRLQKQYGADILEKLAAEKQKIKQFTKNELIELIKKYG